MGFQSAVAIARRNVCRNLNLHLHFWKSELFDPDSSPDRLVVWHVLFERSDHWTEYLLCIETDVVGSYAVDLDSEKLVSR